LRSPAPTADLRLASGAVQAHAAAMDPKMPDGYRLDDFAGALGATFIAGDPPVALRLIEATPLEGTVRAEGSFRLEFAGPADIMLPQAIHRFERDGRSYDIFIVPIARDAEGARYEAIFF
jgi:hypothetical protein